jgi:hypothetical protein
VDKLTLKDGTAVEGEVLDVTEKKVVIAVGKEKQKKTYARTEVGDITRAAPEHLLGLFQRRSEALKASGTAADWKALALFCIEQELLPEHRQALREVLRLAPEDRDARHALGHATLDGRWLDEDEVQVKLQEGFDLVDGRLTRGSGVTALKKEADPFAGGRYRLLERRKLSPAERKKLEKDREDRHKSADKFLAEKAREYQGIPWPDRHKIKTRHFEIQCNSTRHVAEAYAAMMELIRAKLSEMFKSEIKRNLRSAVMIYASQEEFMSLDQQARWMGHGLGGYYYPPTQSITTFHGTFGFTGTTFGVLCHEGTHYYQGLVLQEFANVPIWFIEGLAVYFGDGSLFDPKKAKITIGQIPRERLAHIQEKMLVKRHTAVERLVSMKRQDGFSGSHYADAWALIYFLVNSGKNGERLLQEYWAIGLKRLLTKKDFLDLALKYFDGVANLEKAYVEYILKLDMPPAGTVRGEYFVSDLFQFDYKAPGDDWQFFEEPQDKELLVGILSPNRAAEIRIYFKNNMLWQSPDEYMTDYLKSVSRFKDLKRGTVKHGKLEWQKLTYVDDGSKPLDPEILISSEGGKIEITELKKPEKEKKAPRDVVRYILIQVDGVVEVECSAKQGQIGAFADVFDKAFENFTLCFTRRW